MFSYKKVLDTASEEVFSQKKEMLIGENIKFKTRIKLDNSSVMSRTQIGNTGISSRQRYILLVKKDEKDRALSLIHHRF